MKKSSYLWAKILVCSALLLSTSTVQAAIALDRTRAIFPGDSKSIALSVTNENKQLPYLAQAWLEDADEKKITTGPLVVTPPVQRLDPGKKSLVRIQTVPDMVKQLPQDRESLFYFNLREIPPRSDKANVLQIALQSKIKLFYRPAAIKAASNDIWQDKLVLHKVSGGYKIENPTPYYITVIGMGNSKTDVLQSKFDVVMLAPKSSQVVSTGSYATPYLSYINDHGGTPVLQFKCNGDRCTAVEEK